MYEKLTKQKTAVEEALKRAEKDGNDRVTSVRREMEDTIRRIKGDAETEIASARFQLSEAQQAKQMMEKSVGAMNSQVEVSNFLVKVTCPIR